LYLQLSLEVHEHPLELAKEAGTNYTAVVIELIEEAWEKHKRAPDALAKPEERGER